MPHEPGYNNRIAYVNPEGHLCLIAPVGGTLIVLDVTSRKFQFPAWSPDGTCLAAMSMMPNNSGIFALPIHSSGLIDEDELRPLYVNHIQRPFYLYWSPDNKTISFVASHPQGLGLHLIARTGRDHRLLTIGQPCFWDWTPEGEELLVHTGGSGQVSRLTFINARSADRDEMLSKPGFFQSPGVAPSGRFWAFATLDQNGETQVVVAERTDMARVTVSHHGAVALSWSPVQDVLAFMSPTEPARHFYGALQLLDVHTGQFRTLIDDTVLAFFWSPNGRYIAYFTLAAAIAPGTTPSRTERNGTHTNGYKPLFPTLSRFVREDELILNVWVVHVSSGERRLLTAFQPVEEFISPFLAFFDQYALSHRIWSPTSDALVLSAIVDDRKEVILVTLDSEHPQPIAEGSMACWSYQ